MISNGFLCYWPWNQQYHDNTFLTHTPFFSRRRQALPRPVPLLHSRRRECPNHSSYPMKSAPSTIYCFLATKWPQIQVRWSVDDAFGDGRDDEDHSEGIECRTSDDLSHETSSRLCHFHCMISPVFFLARLMLHLIQSHLSKARFDESSCLLIGNHNNNLFRSHQRRDLNRRNERMNSTSRLKPIQNFRLRRRRMPRTRKLFLLREKLPRREDSLRSRLLRWERNNYIYF